MHAATVTTGRRVVLKIAPTLQMRVEYGRPPLTASLRGELDVATADRCCDVLLDLMTEKTPHLVLDLSELGFCDPYGLGGLVRAANYAERAGGSLTLARPGPRLARLLDVTGLHRRFAVR
jgi:anti-sigma B factor antagonist